MTLTEQVQAMGPSKGYRIRGIVWLLFGSDLELVDREIDEKITGDDAVRFAAMSEGEMLQAVVNQYMTDDMNESDHVGVIDKEHAPDLHVDLIE